MPKYVPGSLKIKLSIKKLLAMPSSSRAVSE